MPELNVGINAQSAARGAKKVNAALDSIGKKGRSLISGVFNPLGAAITALGGAAAVVGVSKITDEFTVMATQLEYLTGNTQDAAQAEDRLYEISRKTGTQMADNAQTFTKLALASEMTGLNMEENLKVVGGLNALMLKTGTSGQQASAAMLQLSQALASGVLQGDEFRSMAENAPGVLSELSKAIGVPRSELKKMASDGELTSQVLGKAFLDIANSAKGSMEEGLPKTVASGWNAVVLAFKEAWDEINDQTGIMGYLRQALFDLADWIEDKTPVFVIWFQNMVEYINANWPGLESILDSVWTKIGNLYDSVVNAGPGMQTFFSNLTTVVSAAAQAVGWFVDQMQWVIDNWGKVQNFLNTATLGVVGGSSAALGTLAGGGSVGEAWDAYGEAATKDYTTDENGQGGSGGITVNINSQMSRSDVPNIVSEMQRREARN